MKVLRYIILAFILWGIPTFALEIFGDATGSMSSYLMFLLMLFFYFLSSKSKLITPFLLLGLTYYLISGIIYVIDFEDYIYKFIKYIIFIIAGMELVKQTSIKEVFFFLLIGAASVIINAAVFQSDYGRYGGFYLNPNAAGFIALVGYCLSFSISNKKLKIIGLFVFTFAGILTLSRYFILMWLILSIVAIIIDRKNTVIFGVGLGSLLIILSIATFLQLNADRFAAIESVVQNQIERGLLFFQEGSRKETWAQYYDMIVDKLFFGNGFETLAGKEGNRQGVHNTFLMTLGEAGLIPFFILIGIFIKLIYKSMIRIKEVLYLGLLVLTIVAYFFVSHNYFDNYIVLFFTLWLYVYTRKELAEEQEISKPLL